MIVTKNNTGNTIYQVQNGLESTHKISILKNSLASNCLEWDKPLLGKVPQVSAIHKETLHSVKSEYSKVLMSAKKIIVMRDVLLDAVVASKKNIQVAEQSGSETIMIGSKYIKPNLYWPGAKYTV